MTRDSTNDRTSRIVSITAVVGLATAVISLAAVVYDANSKRKMTEPAMPHSAPGGRELAAPAGDSAASGVIIRKQPDAPDTFGIPSGAPRDRTLRPHFPT